MVPLNEPCSAPEPLVSVLCRSRLGRLDDCGLSISWSALRLGICFRRLVFSSWAASSCSSYSATRPFRRSFSSTNAWSGSAGAPSSSMRLLYWFMSLTYTSVVDSGGEVRRARSRRVEQGSGRAWVLGSDLMIVEARCDGRKTHCSADASARSAASFRLVACCWFCVIPSRTFWLFW